MLIQLKARLEKTSGLVARMGQHIVLKVLWNLAGQLSMGANSLRALLSLILSVRN